MTVANEDLFTALVLVLSRQIDAEKCKNGVRRMGGDYSREAVALIRRRKPDILELLREQ